MKVSMIQWIFVRGMIFFTSIVADEVWWMSCCLFCQSGTSALNFGRILEENKNKKANQQWNENPITPEQRNIY